ncbi:hypothetical protein BD413DRAFT_611802 [Trametes elegans]|nr:hypothetical protein BD413DRAFT_611802 [Trametes elegans]
MQFSTLFYAFTALSTLVVASPAGIAERAESASAVISEAQMAHWLATTDAELTFIGQPPNPLARRKEQSTTVTYCNKRVGPICGGTCTVYTGGPTCLATNNVQCLTATRDIGFCDEAECNGDCEALSECGTPLGSGFCFAPQTLSILVSSF